MGGSVLVQCCFWFWLLVVFFWWEKGGKIEVGQELAKQLEASKKIHIIWSNYSGLTRPHPKWWFSKGNPLISGKSRLVKYYNLARYNVSIQFHVWKLGCWFSDGLIDAEVCFMMQPEKFDELISASEQINPGKRVHRLASLNVVILKYLFIENYSFSHNPGNGKWLYLKGNDPIGDTPIFDWTMIMGASVDEFRWQKKNWRCSQPPGNDHIISHLGNSKNHLQSAGRGTGGSLTPED